MTETTGDESRAAEDQLVVNGIPTFANPLNGNVAEFDITDSKGLVTLALESVLVMFGWGAEHRHEYFTRVGFDVRDNGEIEVQNRARLSEDPPLNPRSQILELPENSGGQIVDSVYELADRMHGNALREASLRVNNGFQQAAAESLPAVEQLTPQGPNMDPNALGPL